MNAVLRLALRAIFPSLTAIYFASLNSGSAEAITRRVDNQISCSDSGSTTFCTIGAAVSKSNPGDTVSVANGTYNAKVTVTRSGTSSAPITITTSEGAIVKSFSQGFDVSGASWVTINGFTIDSTAAEGVRCTLCSHVKISNNKVKNSGGSGIYINNSSNTALLSNRIEDSGFTGIDVAGSSNVTISGGYVTDSGHKVSGQTKNGIKFGTTSSSLVDGTEVYDNSDTGIYVAGGSHGIRLKRVKAHHNARGFQRIAAGIELRSSGNIVEACKTYSNEDSGINMRWGGSDAIIANNISYWNGDHGIDALESPRPKIVNNSVYKNVTAGINVEGDSDGSYILNNISVENGIKSPRSVGNIRVTSSSPAVSVDRNIVWLSNNGVLYVWKSINYSSLSSLKSANPGVETNGIQAWPNWVSASSGDFHLKWGSPAIDSAKSDAITTGEIAKDAEGRSRCNVSSITDTGSGPIDYMDRGALEYACP